MLCFAEDILVNLDDSIFNKSQLSFSSTNSIFLYE